MLQSREICLPGTRDVLIEGIPSLSSLVRMGSKRHVDDFIVENISTKSAVKKQFTTDVLQKDLELMLMRIHRSLGGSDHFSL